MSSSSETNRLNARKSTGPKTDHGKWRSSQNAITHGLFAKDIKVKGEDTKEFRAHQAGMVRRLNPRDVLELHLVEQIIADTWTIKRVRAAEQELYADPEKYDELSPFNMSQMLNSRAALSENRKKYASLRSPGELLVKLIDSEKLERLDRYQRRLTSSVHRCLKELRELRKANDDPEERLTETTQRILSEIEPAAQNEAISNANDGKEVTCDATLMAEVHPLDDAPTNESIDEDEIEHQSDPSSVPRAA